MDAVFLKLLNMSIAAGWLILAVVVLRLLLRKAPRWLICLLWVPVGVRLVCPWSIESVLSLIPSAETVPPQSLTATAPAIDSGFYAVDRVVNAVLSPSFYPQPQNSVTPLQVLTFVGALVWVLGIAVMLVYAAVSTLRLRHRVREAACLRENIWVCDSVSTPFILGLLRPRILLPSSLSAADTAHVLAHENAHLRRRDHWWKPLGFLLLAVHWFNPLVWLAYVLLCRDIELACDERVVRGLDANQVKAYSTALLDCSTPRRALSACPLAFGEVGVKHRIKAVLHYRKPAFWLVLLAVVACVATAVCFLTDPISRHTEIPSQLDVFIMQTEMERHAPKNPDHVAVEAHQVLLAETVGDTTTVYAWIMNMTYSCEDGQLKAESGSHIPTAITVRETAEGYVLEEYWTPRDGAYYAPDIRGKFPQRIWEEGLDSTRYAAKHTAVCEEKAKIHFGLIDANAPDENVNESFCATVLEVQPDGNGILVDPLAGEWISGKVHVSTNLISTHPLPELKVGDIVRVVFNGEVMETYPAQVNKVFAIYKLETAPTRTVATKAFSVTFSSFYVEKGRIDVTGDGDEQSIGIYERSSIEEYGGLVAGIRLVPQNVDLAAYGPPYTLYGTMQSPAGERYYLIATYPTDVQYSPQAEGRYAVLRGRLDTVMETLTPAEGWRFTPVTVTTPTTGPSGTPPAPVTGTTTAAPTTTTKPATTTTASPYYTVQKKSLFWFATAAYPDGDYRYDVSMVLGRSAEERYVGCYLLTDRVVEGKRPVARYDDKYYYVQEYVRVTLSSVEERGNIVTITNSSGQAMTFVRTGEDTLEVKNAVERFGPLKNVPAGLTFDYDPSAPL